jgi:ADP-heptose:LPS heptosyltransferase
MATALTAPLLRGNPEVDNIIMVNMSAFKGIRGRLNMVQTLGKVETDTVVFLNPNLTFLLAAFWCGIARRLTILPYFMGKTLRWGSRLMTSVEVQGEGELIHQVQQRLLGQIGAVMPSFVHRAYTTDTSPLQLSSHHEWIGIGISSGNKLKELGVEKLSDIIRQLLEKTTCHIALIGSGADSKVAKELVLLHPARIQETTGKIALEVLPDFLTHLSLYIGVDSGITHLADAAGIPVVSIVGPADPREQRPMGKFVEIIQRQEPCAPCCLVFHTPYMCKVGTRACIQQIAADEITKRALSLLHRVKATKHDT